MAKLLIDSHNSEYSIWPPMLGLVTDSPDFNPPSDDGESYRAIDGIQLENCSDLHSQITQWHEPDKGSVDHWAAYAESSEECIGYFTRYYGMGVCKEYKAAVGFTQYIIEITGATHYTGIYW